MGKGVNSFSDEMGVVCLIGASDFKEDDNEDAGEMGVMFCPLLLSLHFSGSGGTSIKGFERGGFISVGENEEVVPGMGAWLLEKLGLLWSEFMCACNGTGKKVENYIYKLNSWFL